MPPDTYITTLSLLTTVQNILRAVPSLIPPSRRPDARWLARDVVLEVGWHVHQPERGARRRHSSLDVLHLASRNEVVCQRWHRAVLAIAPLTIGVASAEPTKQVAIALLIAGRAPYLYSIVHNRNGRP